MVSFIQNQCLLIYIFQLYLAVTVLYFHLFIKQDKLIPADLSVGTEMASRRGRWRETSVIARTRPGIPENFSRYTVSMVIAGALQQYQDILSIGFSTSNFTIGVQSPGNQLSVLYTRTIEGPDFILDIVPWCPEHANYDLPWIIRHEKNVTLPKQPKNYLANLIGHGKPLHQYVGALIARQKIVASTIDDVAEPEEIHVHHLTGLGKMRSMPDFSYLMIIELKDFYRAKFKAFRICAQSCKNLCDCAYQLSEDINPAIKSVSNHAQFIEYTLAEHFKFIVADFDGDVLSKATYIAEEVIGIENRICPLYSNMSSLINLNMFKRRLVTLPDNVPADYASRLKIILEAVIQKIYKSAATITSKITPTGNVITHITAKDYNDYYKSMPMIPKAEAEADAIYRFLRHKTNVLGYNILDLNYPTLASLVCEINKMNEEISELLLCATRAATMIQQVYKDIKKTYEDLAMKVPQGQIMQLDNLAQNLLTVAEAYNIAADHGFDIFKKNKEGYESILLETRYRSTADR